MTVLVILPPNIQSLPFNKDSSSSHLRRIPCPLNNMEPLPPFCAQSGSSTLHQHPAFKPSTIPLPGCNLLALSSLTSPGEQGPACLYSLCPLLLQHSGGALNGCQGSERSVGCSASTLGRTALRQRCTAHNDTLPRRESVLVTYSHWESSCKM